jgi:hypothetical protein
MPLPDFDQFGNLPPGEHLASWPDFEHRYATNPTRTAILRQIKGWLTHMKAARCRSAHIDGSFICHTETPADYDACWDATGVDPTLLDPRLLTLTPEGRLAIKRHFGGDIRPDMATPPGNIRPYLQFFQRDRDGNPKGIVRFDLQDFTP